jgi:hypothetical protein
MEQSSLQRTYDNHILVDSGNRLYKIVAGLGQQSSLASVTRCPYPECQGSRLFLSPALPSTVM